MNGLITSWAQSIRDKAAERDGCLRSWRVINNLVKIKVRRGLRPDSHAVHTSSIESHTYRKPDSKRGGEPDESGPVIWAMMCQKLTHSSAYLSPEWECQVDGSSQGVDLGLMRYARLDLVITTKMEGNWIPAEEAQSPQMSQTKFGGISLLFLNSN
ncbi:hypothetical protein C8R44DRAFT_728886 [Mycena epipterygia]|nr:hypothetical protein C8R44DRAFT_728886 [Mycena epipterygia]